MNSQEELIQQSLKAIEIVKRLKKRIGELKRNGSDWGTTAPILIKELQKILKETQNVITPTDQP